LDGRRGSFLILRLTSAFFVVTHHHKFVFGLSFKLISMPSTTAVRITTISAAQNKRGKDCFEGGMAQGCFTWFKDMGGNSNWMYITVVNVSVQHLSLALWLLYEASTEPLVDPLTGSGSIQVGFFNQSKNLNRQVPLFELAEESKPGLEIGPNQTSTLKVRINDLSSHHQNQRFIIVIGPADAPIRGSRSVPIEIMSKPRVENTTTSGNNSTTTEKGENIENSGSLTSALHESKRKALDASHQDSNQSTNKLQKTTTDSSQVSVQKNMLAALVNFTDPNPPRERKLDLILMLLTGLPTDEQKEVYQRLGNKLRQQSETKSTSVDKTPGGRPGALSSSSFSSSAKSINNANITKPLSPATASVAAAMRAAAEKELARAGEQPHDPQKFQPLVQAIMDFQQNAKQAGTNARPPSDVPAWVNSVLEKFAPNDSLSLTQEQLSSYFDDPTTTKLISPPIDPPTSSSSMTHHQHLQQQQQQQQQNRRK